MTSTGGTGLNAEANLTFNGSTLTVTGTTVARTIRPSGSSYDLGTSSYRWDNIYVQDMQLSNKAKKKNGGNDIDGTWGEWTIQEGENDLFLINRRNGKKYSFLLKEID